MIETLFSFAFATLLLAISPGPDNIFVLTQSVARGSKYGIAIASGLITGCIVHTSIVALGFAVIIRDNDWLLYSIKIAGAIYLLYIAYKIYKSDASIEFGDSKASSQNLWKLYKIGITMNLLNPKVTLFFLALLPQFVIENSYPDWIQIYILGGIFMLVSLLTFSTIALLAGKAASFIKSSKWFAPAMKWTQIVVFIGIAVAILIP
ncbi:threonine/homoserine/homoserine lactone efflux protein [Nonlabens dokdonensis]|uniref:RhtB/LysE family threonine efflux pump n=2 Tax=Nonlabens dokdonensis TaxID=328515 RepID=L7WAT8_NONDD|nr:LysE family translocator [Nonlabens dokdonensis]AGC77287.1 RhtB/LysE family threonine efflux pump [Nonlabens dokdonensis DSW-6]PZX40823.1 threonine/homoserine/homoserine lactone efflux protein [Nonlabens dokdonensis]